MLLTNGYLYIVSFLLNICQIFVIITFLSICCLCYYPVRSLDFLWIWSGFIRWALSVDHLRLLTKHWPHGHHPHQTSSASAGRNQHDGFMKGYSHSICASHHFQNLRRAFRHFCVSGDEVEMQKYFTNAAVLLKGRPDLNFVNASICNISKSSI